MAYPTMTLKEFNEYMQEGHYQYSLFVILQLDEAMEYLKGAASRYCYEEVLVQMGVRDIGRCVRDG